MNNRQNVFLGKNIQNKLESQFSKKSTKYLKNRDFFRKITFSVKRKKL